MYSFPLFVLGKQQISVIFPPYNVKTLCIALDKVGIRTIFFLVMHEMYVGASLGGSSDACPNGDQEVPGLIPTMSGNILS